MSSRRGAILSTLASGCVCLFLLTGPVGCGSSKQTAPISGKVTLDNKLVTGGRVAFFHPDGRTASTLIKSDGTYDCPNAPVGDVTITVESMNFNRYKAMMPKRTGGGKMQDPNNPNPPPDVGAEGSGASVPKQYQDAKTSGLTTTIKAGEANTYEVVTKSR